MIYEPDHDETLDMNVIRICVPMIGSCTETPNEILNDPFTTLRNTNESIMGQPRKRF
jgi:hypothetical protein